MASSDQTSEAAGSTEAAAADGPVSRSEQFALFLAITVNTFYTNQLVAFSAFMVRDFHIAQSEARIGYYSGWVQSAFFVGMGLASGPWGWYADRVGAAPVLVSSLLFMGIFYAFFGFSTSLTEAVVFR